MFTTVYTLTHNLIVVFPIWMYFSHRVIQFYIIVSNDLFVHYRAIVFI